jgi:acetoin utilization protein AcuB
MSTDLITVTPGETLVKVRELFEKHNIHHIPVVKFKEIVGMISKTDYLYFKQGCLNGEGGREKEVYQLNRWNAEEIMTSKLAKLDSDDPIRTALDLFRLNRFHALPVIDNGKLVGILTTHDIIDALADEKVTLEDYRTAK